MSSRPKAIGAGRRRGTMGRARGGWALGTRAVAVGLGLATLAGGAAGLAGCATVAQNRRGHLADPMMSLTGESLDAARHQKLYDTREGAAGGDGATAGGGCGCQ